MIEAPLNMDLVAQTINFHGQQLQKIWEGERGEGEMSDVLPKLDNSLILQRQKKLNFQDRGKRLKLQHFIVKQANALFDLSFVEGHFETRKNVGEEEFYAVLPPYEVFLPVDKSTKTRYFFQVVKKGNIVIGTVVSKTAQGLVIKVLSLEGDDRVKYVADLQLKAFCPMTNLIPAVDKKNSVRTYLLNEAVCCEVVEVIADNEKLLLGMKGTTLPPGSDQHSRLGLIMPEDFPDVFRRVQERKDESYDTLLKRNVAFNNPGNIPYLATSMGLNNKSYSNIVSLRKRFPEQEYAVELRQVQATKWAFRSVADGIEHFRNRRHSEAFQCLNKALSIDPRNIEGLVARGALYANSGSFQKAMDDFEMALKINPNHQNARKYMGDTLVALGSRYEEENKLEEAFKAFEKCLSLAPYHEEAHAAMEYLKSKLSATTNTEPAAPAPVAVPPKVPAENKDPVKLLRTDEMEMNLPPPGNGKREKERKSKKKKDRKSRKRRHHSSSSSSSSSSGSSGSSYSSSSSSSDSSSGSSRSGSSRSRSRSRKSAKKRRKSKSKNEEKREKSLSPLSKRMALMTDDVEGKETFSRDSSPIPPPPPPPSVSHGHREASHTPAAPLATKESDYELQVKKFLEHTKDDSDYEEKVRKFLEESARWRKEKKDEKTKKKKKKEKKSHDKDKGKKKKRDREDRKKRRSKKSSGSSMAGILPEKGSKMDVGDPDGDGRKLRDALLHRRLPQHIADADDEFLYSAGAEAAAAQRESLGANAPVHEKTSYGSSALDGGSGQKGDSNNLSSLGILPLDSVKELDDLQSKLQAYYAKYDKDTGVSKRYSGGSGSKSAEKSSAKEKSKAVSPKGLYLHDDDKTEDSLRFREKSPLSGTLATPAIMSSKWKMQINSGNRLKKKEKSDLDKDAWDDLGSSEKRFSFLKSDKSDDESPKKKLLSTASALDDKGRKPIDRKEELSPPGAGKFRKIDLGSSPLGDDLSPKGARGRRNIRQPSRDTDSGSASSSPDRRDKKKKKIPRRSRSRSSGASSRSRSRSREKREYSRGSSASSSDSYKKKRIDRSKSRSVGKKSGSYERYRSRSQSYKGYRSSASRSRSRSHERRSYYSRSRSYERSRSRSRDYRRSRSPSDRRGYYKYQGRFPRQHGNYYNRRFQNNKNYRGFVPRGRGGYYNKFNPNNRGRGFIPRMRGRGRNRFMNYKPGFRDYNRYGPRRQRDRDSADRGSSVDDDPMRKVDAVKERIDKMIEEREPDRDRKRKDESLSEGEERDDDEYEGPPGVSPGSADFIDRKKYEGKWAEKVGSGSGGPRPEGPKLPSESPSDLDSYSKGKKREDSKERKSVSKW